MRRLFLFLLLTIMLPWQAVTVMAATLVHNNDTSTGHAFHDDYVKAHHHHEDGSVHYDDSDASYQHLNEHASANGACVLIFTPFHPPVTPTGSAAFNLQESFAAPPYLEGPHRPPRLLG